MRNGPGFASCSSATPPSWRCRRQASPTGTGSTATPPAPSSPLRPLGHAAILAVSSAGFTYGYWLYGNASGLILTLLSLGLGILLLCSLGTRFERSWHRYVLVAAEALLLTAAGL